MSETSVSTGSLAGTPTVSVGSEISTTPESGTTKVSEASVEADATTLPEGDKKPAESTPKKPKKSEKKTKKAPNEAAPTQKVTEAAKKLVDTVLDEAGKAAQQVDTTPIKMLRSHPDFAYHAGEEGQIPADKADFLIAGGFAQAAGTVKTEPESKA